MAGALPKIIIKFQEFTPGFIHLRTRQIPYFSILFPNPKISNSIPKSALDTRITKEITSCIGPFGLHLLTPAVVRIWPCLSTSIVSQRVVIPLCLQRCKVDWTLVSIYDQRGRRRRRASEASNQMPGVWTRLRAQKILNICIPLNIQTLQRGFSGLKNQILTILPRFRRYEATLLGQAKRSRERSDPTLCEHQRAKCGVAERAYSGRGSGARLRAQEIFLKMHTSQHKNFPKGVLLTEKPDSPNFTQTATWRD